MEFSTRLSTFTTNSLEAGPEINSTLASLTQIYEQCKVLPIPQSLCDLIERHLNIVKCQKITHELDRAVGNDGASSGLAINDFSSLIVPHGSNKEEKEKIAGLTGTPLALSLYRTLKEMIEKGFHDRKLFGRNSTILRH